MTLLHHNVIFRLLTFLDQMGPLALTGCFEYIAIWKCGRLALVGRNRMSTQCTSVIQLGTYMSLLALPGLLKLQ
jgi:hypothetical protein